MKKITYLILLLCFASHFTAKAHFQTIILSFKNASLYEILQSISKQSNYVFAYSREGVPNIKPITIEISSSSMEVVLNELFKYRDITYSIVDSVVVLRRKSVQKIQIESSQLSSDRIEVSGRVLNEKGEPLASASVKVKGTEIGTATDGNGFFRLMAAGDATLIVSIVGYETQLFKISGVKTIEIQLQLAAKEMDEVLVVNTGYQQLSKERATGSFEYINNEKLNRRIGPDILSRLEGVSASVLIDKRRLPGYQNSIDADKITIRGLSTISSTQKAPLVIVNNFPYEGDINNLNPNDVESISILKDAAAASIWGARAANGVIVITTKKAQYNQPGRISFATNTNIIEKPDLFYYPQMSTTDFISLETFLFQKGFYNGLLNNKRYPGLSPVVELLALRRSGQISEKDSADAIEQFRKNDVRHDFEKYIYRTSISQQYSIQASGGNDKLRYSISAGYDKNPSVLVGDKTNRFTLRTDNSFLVNKDFEIQLGIAYANSLSVNNSLGDIGSTNYDYRITGGPSQKLYPYARFVDDDGNLLSLPRDYREGYTDTAGVGKLLNWKYRPLEELNLSDKKNYLQDIVLNFTARYKITPAISAELRYQYEQSNGQFKNLRDETSYYARNLINLFSQIDGNSIQYKVPKGGILSTTDRKFIAQVGGVMLNYSKTFSNNHQIAALGGAEIRQAVSSSNSAIFYGYNKNTLSSSNVDFVNFYPRYGNRGNGIIPGGTGATKLVDRFVSLYTNASYTYDSRYLISVSARNDASNIFGVDFNNKWKPLWSIGGAWNVSNETFLHVKFVDYLRLRTTYGFQGNVNNTLSPKPIIIYEQASLSPINQPFAFVANPGNPDLGWEKTRQINFGLDFRILNNRISGTIEVYHKLSKNLLLVANMDPTTGVSFVTKNSASMATRGIELTFNSTNIHGKVFKWSTDLLFSYVNNKVTDYLIEDKDRSAGGLVGEGGSNVMFAKGRAPYGVYSYAFAGLDPQSGEPLGYLNGKKTNDYQGIFNQSVDTAQIIYHGSALPPYFGALNNSLSVKRITLNIGILYRFGYYFKRDGISYSSLVSNGLTHPDFGKRWQKPGDENHTTIPAFIYPDPTNGMANTFYQQSSINILKGDHVRLGNIRLAYDFGKMQLGRFPLRNIQVYFVATNLGIIWRANNERLDPDNSTMRSFPVPKSFAGGLNMTF